MYQHKSYDLKTILIYYWFERPWTPIHRFTSEMPTTVHVGQEHIQELGIQFGSLRGQALGCLSHDHCFPVAASSRNLELGAWY